MPAIRTTAPGNGAPGNSVPACVTPEILSRFLNRRNPNVAPTFQDIARVYKVIGEAYSVRWDYAFFQMLVETNNLSFLHRDGTPRSVRPEQHNFAGLGAIGPGERGDAFADVATGVQAHIEHILLYAGQRIEDPIAERTRKVQTWGVLDSWLAEFEDPITFRDLALRWFPFSGDYARNLAAVARKFFSEHCPGYGETAIRTATVTRDRVRLSTAWVSAASAGSGPRIGGQQATDALRRQSSRQDAGVITPPKPRLAKTPPSVQVAALERKSTVFPPVRTPLNRVTGTRPTRPAAPAKVRKQRAAVPSSATAALKPKQTPSRAAARPKPAKPKRLSPDDKVRKLVAGRLVHLRTDMGATIPIKFDETGRMRGSAGNLAFFLGASRDSGRWWVKREKLCKRWKVWLSAKTWCLKLKQRGRVVHWRADDGRSGTAKIVR